MLKLLSLLIITSAVLSHAAPSFDCKKAIAPIEKAICADPKLSELDRQIADAYTAVLATASEAEKAAVKSEQQTFNKERTGVCKDLKVECLKALFEKRLSALSSPKASPKPSWEGCFRGPDQMLCISGCDQKGCKFSFEGVQAAPCSDEGRFIFTGKDQLKAVFNKVSEAKKKCAYNFELSNTGGLVGVDDTCGNCSVGTEFDFTGDYERSN